MKKKSKVKKVRTVKKVAKPVVTKKAVVKPEKKKVVKPAPKEELDPKTLCARGGCIHPRSIHITGECHQKSCSCIAFVEPM